MEVYFETYGCTANYNSSEIMRGLVKQAGMNITENPQYADLIIINSCVVKEPTEEKIRRRIQDLLKKNKKIILSGCMPKLNHKKLQNKKLYLLSTNHVKDIINLIQDIENETYKSEKYLKDRNEVKLNLPKIPENKYIGITQISEGCLGKCTYCLTRIAKGKLFSYPEDMIIKSVKGDVESGCKEIWITSQDNAAYGNEEGKYNLPELLKKILEIKGNFLVRLGMSDPNNVLKILPELIEIYKAKKMFKFLHIPVQSGSNKILKKMNRRYNKSDVLEIVEKFRKEFPDIHISTDVIVGFSGETEEDFQETVELIKKVKPETMNISKFWPRPRTPAAKFDDQISPEIKKKRAIGMSKVHFKICIENQKNWIGKETKVLVDQKGIPGFPATYLARDENYKLFAVFSKEKLLGKKIKVKVTRTTPHYLISEKSNPQQSEDITEK